MYLREIGRYTPIRPDLVQPGKPASLILGMCGKMNKENISKFSEEDAEAYEVYEQELEQFVKAIDPLLDTEAIDVRYAECVIDFYLCMENIARALKDATMLYKMKLLKHNWQLVKSAKILGPHAQAFLELMTAPTAKILDKWWVTHKRVATYLVSIVS